MTDDNSAVNNEYEELDVQRTSYSNSDDLSSSYMSVTISMAGKIFIGLMIFSLVISLCFLVFSYTPYGRTFLRNLELTF